MAIRDIEFFYLVPKYARKTAGGRFSVSWLLHKSDQGNRISMKPIEKKSLYLKISDSIYRFIQQEDSQNGNDSIWLATIPQHLALAQALKDCKLAAAIQAIDEINEYGFKIARK